MQFFQDAFQPEGRRRRLTTSTGGRSGYTAENLRVVTKTLSRVMKITAFLLLVCCLQVSATGISQTVTYSGKDVSLTEIFNVIEKQTGYLVVASKKQVDKAKPVTVDAKDLALEVFLQLALAEQPFTFTMEDRTISIKMKSVVNLSPQLSVEAPPVNGIIRDADGNPIAGVNIVVKGTRRGITTDAQGKFSIDAKENDVLVISSIGYNVREVKITSVNVPHIVALEKSISELDEVQYIAYGTTSKRFSTSSTTTVTAAEIEKQPVNNPLLALQGRVPGMTIMQQNGIPGGGITMRIQGRSNLDNSFVGSDPFIVIDGVPYASQNLLTFKGGTFDGPVLGSSSNDGQSQNNLNYFGNPLAYVNPADIEAITVLRDADATAIYGSRASNGAILITTKKGKAGTMKVDVNLQHGWGRVPEKMDLLNSQQYMEMRWEAKRNDGSPVGNNDFDLRGVWDTTRFTDWQDVLIGGTAQFSRFTASVSGGANNFNYLVSSTYGRETSVFPSEFANTFGSLHFNISVGSSNQRFKLQLGGNYMANINKLPAEDYTTHALNLPPVAPALYNPDGSLNWAPDPVTGNSSWWNPLSWKYKLFETETNNLLGNGSVSYSIIPGLELKSTFGFTSTASNQFLALLDESEKPERRETRWREATFSFNTSRTWIVEPQIVFQQKWVQDNFSFLIGTSLQSQDNDGREMIAYGQTTDLLLRNMLSGIGVAAGKIDVNEYKYNAVFGRVSYIRQNRYLLNVSARRDGSSRFGSKSQFANFGALGVGWILSEEPFFKKNLPFISFAKVRGSYGTTGNDQIGNYRFLNLYESFYPGIPYQSVGISHPVGLPNPNLEWEETRKLQGGLDVGFLKDKVLMTVNYFRNRTSNSLTTVNMPRTTGYESVVVNLPALIQNTGWELSLASTLINSRAIRWHASGNLTIPQNKLLAFPELETSPLGESMKIGYPLTTESNYPFFGVDPLTGAYLVADKNGEPTKRPGIEDATIFLNSLPRWYGGLQNSIQYRGFSIDFFIQFTKQKGYQVEQNFPIPGFFRATEPSFMFGNQPTEVMSRWQKPGDVSTYQRFALVGSPGIRGDRYYEDLSFIRIKNLSLSYDLKVGVMRKLNIEKFRVYTNAQNLVTLSRYRGLDPETRSISSLPPLRVVTIGIQATL